MAAFRHLEFLIKICSFYHVIMSFCLSEQISIKSGNRLLSYGQKTISNMAAVRHLELSKSFLVIWLSSHS